MGRPSSFTQDLADAICEELAEGHSLREICKAEGMPSRTSVLRWLDDNEAFRSQYARAREAQAHAYADQIVTEAFTSTDAALGRLRMDALKWTASKLAPKVYGDKVALTGGSEGDAPLNVVTRIERVIVKPE